MQKIKSIAIGTLIFTFMFNQDIDRALVDSISAITTAGLYQIEAEVLAHDHNFHKKLRCLIFQSGYEKSFHDPISR